MLLKRFGKIIKNEEICLALKSQFVSGGSRLIISAGIGFPRQWQIQDFPEGGANSKRGAKTYYFANVAPKSAWKWKNVDRLGACVPGISLDPQCLRLIIFPSCIYLIISAIFMWIKVGLVY